MTVRNARLYRQAIETKYLGPTNMRGGRVKARSEAGSVTLSWDHSLNSDANHTKAAQALADKLGWSGDLWGGGHPDGRGCVFVFAEEN